MICQSVGLFLDDIVDVQPGSVRSRTVIVMISNLQGRMLFPDGLSEYLSRVAGFFICYSNFVFSNTRF